MALSGEQRNLVAQALLTYAEQVQENLEDDERERGDEEGEPNAEGYFPVVEDYQNEATRILTGETPCDRTTWEVLESDSDVIALLDADKREAYRAAVALLVAQYKAEIGGSEKLSLETHGLDAEANEAALKAAMESLAKSDLVTRARLEALADEDTIVGRAAQVLLETGVELEPARVDCCDEGRATNDDRHQVDCGQAPLGPQRLLEVDAAVARGKVEILECVLVGQIPADVESFSDLHDHVDANEFGGLCDEGSTDTPDWITFGNAVQDALHEWIVAGGLRAIVDAVKGGE